LKTLKQRFIELYNASGWKQAELARRMDKTRGGINGIITGDTSPDPSSVKMLEMLMLQAGKTIPGKDLAETAKLHVAEIEARNNEADVLKLKLSEIQERAPEKFKAAKTMIESLHSQINYRTKKVSSDRAKKGAMKTMHLPDQRADKVQPPSPQK
jgi:transcriptional regulator with XRE-family HTH domain